MNLNKEKKNILNKYLIKRLIIWFIVVVMIIVITMILTMQNSEQLYVEGIAKGTNVLDNDKMKKLGDIYIKLNSEFENEMIKYQNDFANRTNKRGDKIFYGVNGNENVDELYNDDYVNGFINNYINNDPKRKDGKSNFIDMVSALNAGLGSDIDKYTIEELEEIFTNLFKLTHTFTGSSTDLYPCQHGCAYVKYYCGDNKVMGFIKEEPVGYYNCDEYMCEKNQYGLMYDPFLIDKESNYVELLEMAGNEREFFTEYKYKDVEVIQNDDNSESHIIIDKKDKVVTDNDEIFLLHEAEGYCPVCEDNFTAYKVSTKKFGGCINQNNCYHGECALVKKDADDEGEWVDWYMEKDKANCDNYAIENATCNHVHNESCENEETGCTHICEDPDLLDTGYYVCLGHPHYACPGHILVCCFGHTNLNMDIKIMYYEEIINVLSKLIK